MKPILFALLSITLVLGACKKSDQNAKLPLAVTSLLPSSGMAGTLVTINGRGFGADTLSNIVTFNGAKTSIFQITDTSLVVIAPAGGTTGSVQVSVGGSKVSAGTYTYQLLSIHTVSPLNGPAGTNVIITGAGFVSGSGLPVVSFNGRPGAISNATDTILAVAVPDSAGTGPITIQANGQSATGPVFTYQHISAITPLSGGAGTIDTIHGQGFGSNASLVSVDFNGTIASVSSVIADTLITVAAPKNVKTGPVSVTINNQKTVGPVFTVVPPPSITSVTPSSGLPGAKVVIAGANFSAVAYQNMVTLNGVALTVQQSTTTQLTLLLPSGIITGPLVLNVNGQSVTGPIFTVQVLNITALTPNNGLAGTTVLISGNGFSTTAASNKILFNGVAATVVSAQDTQLTVLVPSGVTTGNVTVSASGLNATGPVFSRAGVMTYYNVPNGTAINGMAFDLAGNLYFTLAGNSSIQKLTPSGAVSVFAGNPNQGGGSSSDGPVAGALFSNYMEQISIDAQGNMYVYDAGNQNIREISASGIVSTLAAGIQNSNGLRISNGQLIFGMSGGGVDVYNFSTNTYGSAFPNAGNNNPTSLALDANGNIYFNNQYGNNQVIEYSGLPSPAQVERWFNFNNVTSLGTDPISGNVVCTDGANLTLTMFDMNTHVQTILMQASGGYQDGNLSQAQFSNMQLLAVDPQGAYYITEQINSNPAISRIRKVYIH